MKYYIIFVGLSLVVLQKISQKFSLLFSKALLRPKWLAGFLVWSFRSLGKDYVHQFEKWPADNQVLPAKITIKKSLSKFSQLERLIQQQELFRASLLKQSGLPMNAVVYSLEQYRYFGHLATIGYQIKANLLGRSKKRLFVQDKLIESNPAFFSLIASHIEPIRFDEKVNESVVSSWDHLFYNDEVCFLNKFPYIHLENEFRKASEPLMKLSKEDSKQCESLLKAAAHIGADQKFVLLHLRLGASKYETGDLRRPDRDVLLDDYLPALKYLVDCGYKVVRLGDTTAAKMPLLAGVFDYAHSAVRSQLMDFYLFQTCAFFVGTNSGPAVIVDHFGRRKLLTNHMPLWHHSCHYEAVLLPRLLVNEGTNQMLNFEAFVASPHSKSSNHKLLNRHYKQHICAQSNSSDEIYAAVVDFEQNFYDLGHNLVGKVQNTFNKYSFDVAHRIDIKFLEKHANLVV